MKSKCPDCGSNNTRDFKKGRTLISGAGRHHMCNDCRNLWSDEYIVQKVLGTLRVLYDRKETIRFY